MKKMKITTAGSLPPEAAAYALARFSRSADSFEQSVDWVRSHDSSKFLETYYFQYGHPSIADLGHITLAAENISEIAAVELLDEPLLDAQQKSTRYQDFSKVEPVIPFGMNRTEEQLYCDAFADLLGTYREVLPVLRDHLSRKNPRPSEMTPDAYDRAINARAFDNARYLLPMGIPTNVGQVTSIRTLEKQVRRLLGSRFSECQVLGEQMRLACAREPEILYFDQDAPGPVAPTLARHLDPNFFEKEICNNLSAWYSKTVGGRWSAGARHETANNVRLYRVSELFDQGMKILTPSADVLASVLYPMLEDSSFNEVLSLVFSLKHKEILEAFDIIRGARGEHNELPRAFRNQPYTFELTLDLGAYRDLHRHRRCQQIRQPYGTLHGYERPPAIIDAGLMTKFSLAVERAHDTFRLIWPSANAAYILPMATRVRALFKMDTAEVDYICRLRSKVGGHFSYRKIVWDMFQLFRQAEPYLGQMVDATSPKTEAPLCR